VTRAERAAVRVAVGAVAVGALLAFPRSAPSGPGVTCAGPDAAVTCALADAEADRAGTFHR
jgi:hypothetical protein